MPAVASRLSIRAFLEGVEIPVIAVQVNSSPNSAMVASIQAPPLSEGMKILPRTLVHVFFNDFGGLQIGAEQRSQNVTSSEEGAQDESAMAGYRLLFVGEVVGIQWTKKPLSRSLVFQCMDLSSYWDTAYQWMNTDIFGPGYKAVFSGGGTDMFTDFLASASEMVTRQLTYGMRKGSIQYPALRGLLGGIVRLLEKIGGAYMRGNCIPGSNAFFSLAELRLHITQMISAYDQDPTAQRLLGGSFDGFFGRTIGNLGDHTDMRKVINALMPSIFHETYAQPCPFYTPGSGGTVDGYKRTTVMASAKTQIYALKGREIAIGVEELLQSLDLQPSVSSIVSSVRSLQNECRVTANTVRAKNEARIRGHLTQAASILGGASGAASRWKKGTKNDTTLRGKLRDAASKLRAIESLTVNHTSKQDARPARLHQQILRPDIWFGPPPRCNVIFPDQYMQVDYQRMFLQEPTRLLLKTHDEFFGEDMLFDNLYFAPYAKGLRGKSKNLLQNMLRKDILEHELYTGILPIYEKMGEFNIFAARAGAVNGRNAKVPATQRTVNFLYFKHRFESRGLSVVMRFDPYIACGFPCLVIDKYLDADLLRRHGEMLEQFADAPGGLPTDMVKHFGTHFLGNAHTVSHSLQQDQGGITHVQMNYARQADESIEFLGMHEEDERIKTYKRYEKSALRTTDVASISPPRVGSLGPAFGQIVRAIEVTNEYAPTHSPKTSYPELPLYMSRRKGEASMPLVEVGAKRRARDFSSEVADMFDFPDQIVQFKAYRVYEEIPRYRREVTNLPTEELIRPGWYGDIWHPGNIGKAYEFFLGIGSICDQQQVLDAGNQEVVYEGSGEETTAMDPLDAFAETENEQQFSDMAPAILSLMKKYGLDKDGKATNWVRVLDGVEFLMHVYSYVKQNPDISVDDFIRSYTWRPIATMLEIFGTPDLRYEYDPNARTQTVASGIEGFHSRAFMPAGMSFGEKQGDIFTLVPDEVEKMIGVSRDDRTSMFSNKGDVRKQKQDAVLDYLSSLLYAKAILG